MEKETLTDREVLLLRRKLDLLLRTGKLLMESAADTNRIERNMKRVAAFMGIPEEKLHQNEFFRPFVRQGLSQSFWIHLFCFV